MDFFLLELSNRQSKKIEIGIKICVSLSGVEDLSTPLKLTTI